jgi:hypothetical protein
MTLAVSDPATVGRLRIRYPEGLICVRCALIVATRRESLARSGLTNAQRVSYVCAECRADLRAEAAHADARRANLAAARVAPRVRSTPSTGRSTGSLRDASAIPRPERESDTGFVTSATRPTSRQGGRPRAAGDAATMAAARMRRYRARQRQTRAEASRAYRARQRHPLGAGR